MNRQEWKQKAEELLGEIEKDKSLPDPEFIELTEDIGSLFMMAAAAKYEDEGGDDDDITF